MFKKLYAQLYNWPQALKEFGLKEKVQVATKFGVTTRDGQVEIRGDPGYIRPACEASLIRLGVECIDLYYPHRVDTCVPIEVTVCPFVP